MIILGKKSYYCATYNDETGERAEHYRMRGIPSSSMEAKEDSVRDQYLDLAAGEEITYNVHERKPNIKTTVRGVKTDRPIYKTTSF